MVISRYANFVFRRRKGHACMPLLYNCTLAARPMHKEIAVKKVCIPVGSVTPLGNRTCFGVTTRCQYRTNGSSSKHVWTGLHWWPPDVISRGSWQSDGFHVWCLGAWSGVLYSEGQYNIKLMTRTYQYCPVGDVTAHPHFLWHILRLHEVEKHINELVLAIKLDIDKNT